MSVFGKGIQHLLQSEQMYRCFGKNGGVILFAMFRLAFATTYTNMRVLI